MSNDNLPRSVTVKFVNDNSWSKTYDYLIPNYWRRYIEVGDFVLTSTSWPSTDKSDNYCAAVPTGADIFAKSTSGIARVVKLNKEALGNKQVVLVFNQASINLRYLQAMEETKSTPAAIKREIDEAIAKLQPTLSYEVYAQASPEIATLLARYRAAGGK